MQINCLCISYVFVVDIFTRSFDDFISMKFLIAVFLSASPFILFIIITIYYYNYLLFYRSINFLVYFFIFFFLFFVLLNVSPKVSTNKVVVRSSRWQMFFKIVVVKNFAIFTGKRLRWSLF